MRSHSDTRDHLRVALSVPLVIALFAIVAATPTGAAPTTQITERVTNPCDGTPYWVSGTRTSGYTLLGAEYTDGWDQATIVAASAPGVEYQSTQEVHSRDLEGRTISRYETTLNSPGVTYHYLVTHDSIHGQSLTSTYLETCNGMSLEEYRASQPHP